MSGTAVSSGVTSSGLVLSTGAVLHVLAGGTAVSTTVSAGGIADVSGGGSAIGTEVSSRGLVAVLSGGATSDTVLNAYASEQVHGAATSTVVNYAASQTVFAGGTAIGSVVDGSEIVSASGVTTGVALVDGQEIVSAGGVARDTIVAYSSGAITGDGQIYVASGGTIAGAVVNHDGYVALSGGAVAVSTILSGGDEDVAGGTAIGTTIGSGGVETVSVVYVFSTGDYLSGVASATTIAGGTLDLEGGVATGGILFTGSGPGLAAISGTVMPATTISGFAANDAIDLQSLAYTGAGTASLNPSTDVLTVTEGGSSFSLHLAGSYAGTTFNLTPDAGSGTIVAIDGGGTIQVSSGVTSSALVLSNGAVLNVLSGGTAVSTTVDAGSIASISGGGSAIGTEVNSRGLVEVLNGGVTSDTVLSAYASERVYGAAISTAVNYAASQTVFAGGTAIGSVVGGSEIVFAGGITTGVALVDGQEIVSAGGVARDTIVAYSSGAITGNGQVYVASGGTIAGAVVNHDGYVALSGGAVAISTILSGGDEDVAGGTAIGTTIGSGGVETVSVVYVISTGDYLSGVVSATTIAGGTLDLEGGVATGGILFTGSGPGLAAISGTVMPATTISGFAASDAIDLQSIAYTGAGTVTLNPSTDVLTVTEGGSSFTLQLAGAYAGTTFNLTPDAGSGTIVAIDGGGTIQVSSGVTSSGLVLSNGAVLHVFSGGTAVATTVDAGSIASVSGGGSAIGTLVVSRGLIDVLSGGVTSDTAVSAYAGEQVYGTAISTVVNYAASQTVFAGGTAIGSVVDGSEIVSARGVTSGVAVIDGQEIVSAGGVASDTIVAYSSGAITGNGQVYVASGGTIAGAVVNHDGYVALSGGAVAVSTILSGGDEDVAGGTAIGTTIGSGGVETVSVVYVISTGDYLSGVVSATTIAGGTLDLDGGVATGGILFTGSGAGLAAISGTVMPATTISGFAANDAIDLQSVAYTGAGTVTLNPSTDVLTVTEGGSSFTLQLAGSYSGETFNLTPDGSSGTVIAVATSATVIGTSNVPCFAAGTCITTERGEIAVEHLAIGDRLQTVEGDMKPITWIGSRRVDCGHHPEPTKVWPVLILAHAFGADAPLRDLLLSPDHAVFVDNVLIPVKHLINGATIRQIVTSAVTYVHVGLDRHSVILAEGLPVESYLDTGDAHAFETASGPILLHPAFASERANIALVMEVLGYAPLRVTGPEVAAVRARLADRATHYFHHRALELGAVFLAPVEQQQREDDDAVDDAAAVIRHVEGQQHAHQHGEADRARDRTEIVSASAENIDAADDDGRDRLEQVGVAHAERGLAAEPHQHDARHRREEPAQRIEHDGHGRDVDARQVAGAGIVAHGVGRASEARHS
jgi:autotransporter passenger strand-loop-strand repeat protein